MVGLRRFRPRPAQVNSLHHVRIRHPLSIGLLLPDTISLLGHRLWGFRDRVEGETSRLAYARVSSIRWRAKQDQLDVWCGAKPWESSPREMGVKGD